MNGTNFTDKLINKAEKNFKNIKESLMGLYNILNIVSPEEGEEPYFEMGKENVIGLYENLLELILNDYGTRHLIKKIKNHHIKLDLPLDETVEIENE